MSLRDFFYLQKSDRISILFLVFVILFVGGAIWFLGEHETSTPLTAEDSLAMANFRDTVYRRSYGGYPSHSHHYYNVPERKVERFAFDPNTADSTQLLRLGISPFIVRNIYRYRAAGGIYRRPEDFARMYGLTRKQFEELRPYIHISDDYQEARSFYKSNHSDVSPRDTITYPIKLVLGETVQLNTADTSALKHVPGIGSGFARRIVRYRQQLGGFVSVDQLREINDFPESALGYFQLGKVQINRLNVNQSTLNQLKAHPYLNFYQAKAITDYRRLHGPLQNIQQLRLLEEFTPEDLSRLAPYLAS